MCCITQNIFWFLDFSGKFICGALSNNPLILFRFLLRYLSCCPMALRSSLLVLFFFFATFRYCFLASLLYVLGLSAIISVLHSASISLSLSSRLLDNNPRSV